MTKQTLLIDIFSCDYVIVHNVQNVLGNFTKHVFKPPHGRAICLANMRDSAPNYYIYIVMKYLLQNA